MQGMGGMSGMQGMGGQKPAWYQFWKK